MRANLPEKELQTLKFWNEIDLWKKLRHTSKERKKFILHDGPPYANGPIHMGTAANKILKDIINRTMQIEGYDAEFVPGWDCHGLPIEWQIEKEYRKKGLNNISDVKIPIGKSLFDTYDKRPEIISAHIISEMLSVLEKKSSV